MDKRYWLVGIIAIALVFGVMWWAKSPVNEWVCLDGSWVKQGNSLEPMPTSSCGAATTTEAALPINSAVFTCSDDRMIAATFYSERVELILENDRVLSLPQATSASGARYSTPDESIVFWNKGEGAFLEENGRQTYPDCLETGK